MSRFIELSHPVVEGMETYRPLPTPQVEVLSVRISRGRASRR
jgi:hypothetical protein